MIKFFRHIRKSLLNEGKTGKYLKYALGEIVLVVIGILIAVQINNWNVDRINQKKEIELLKELLTDVEADAIFFNSRFELLEGHLVFSDKLAQIYNGLASEETKNSPYTFDYHIFGLSMAYQSIMVENFKNDVELFTNDSIKKEIRKYILNHHYISLHYQNKDRTFNKYGEDKEILYFNQVSQLNEKNTILDYYNSIEYKKHHSEIQHMSTTVKGCLLRTRILLNNNRDLKNLILVTLNNLEKE